MSDLDALARRGIRMLLGRQALVQILTFGGGVALARMLTPAQFGLYVIAGFVVAALGSVGDFGLSPSLIQQRETITALDLRVAFTVQLASTTVIVAAIAVGSHWLLLLYPHASPSLVWLTRALLFQLYVTSFRSISVLQLERELRYGAVAAIEVTESLLYQATAVALAAAGLGVWSFAVAVTVRACVGSVAAYFLAPWDLRPVLDLHVARRLLRFGVPFQVAAFVQQVGGWLTPVFAGSLLGPGSVGALTWASANARRPLVLVECVMRVAFPHLSRMQDDRIEVQRLVLRYLRPLLLGSSLWFSLIAVAAPGLVPFVYGHRWTPAVPSLIIFSGALCLETVAWVLSTGLSGIGAVGTMTRANICRSAIALAVGVTLISLVGMVGAAIGALVSVVAMVPMLPRPLGALMQRRVAILLVTAAGPAAAGIGAGLVASNVLPLPAVGRSAAAALVCLAAFAGAALALGFVRIPRPLQVPTEPLQPEISA